VDVAAGEVKVWPFYAMMAVRKALKSTPAGGEKVDVKVERAKKKEALSISPAENAAALAAPARPKRERAKKVDYLALSKGS
jgi:hypothetical protein